MLVSLAFAALVFTRIDVRSDLTDLMPASHDPAVRLMAGELRSGVASSLVLIAIEGADGSSLARISDRLADALSHDPHFLFAQNGHHLLDPDVIGSLFRNRLLLSPNTVPDAFAVAALRADFIRLRDGLASSASPLVQQFGLPDPTGALPALLSAWQGDGHAVVAHGVWFAGPGHNRALLVARLRAGGADLAGQRQGIASLRATFAAIAPAARLLLTGSPLFAQAAAAGIESDVRMLSIVSVLLVAGWLVWRFRSPWVLAAIAVTVPLSLAVAALAVQAAFGFVHGITLGFGMTMLGVTVDYPVLLVGHRKQGEPAADTIRRIAGAFTLSVLTASLGLSGMAGSSFPGVAQLGLFSVVGILTAAAATRWLLPRLIEQAGVAPSYAGDPRRLVRIEALRRGRAWGLLLPVGALAVIVMAGGPRLDRDLASLTPVPPALIALDAELRGQLGAPDIGQLAITRASTPDAVLQAEEAVRPLLDRLRQDGTLPGADFAARLLPSLATQRARQAALPDGPTLQARIAAASDGLGFTAQAFAPFADAVAAARVQAPLTAADLPSSLLQTRLDALLFHRVEDGDDGSWYGAIIPVGIADPPRFHAAFAALPGWSFIDIRQTTEQIVAGYTKQAWPFLAAGCVAAVLVLLVGQRDPLRSLRILGAIAATLVVLVAILVARGTRLSLIHLVSLQFVAGIGLDYALFFARTQLDAEERARTLRTLVTCNVMALLTFSLLCLCHTPLLRQIGSTVSIGVVLALGFGFLFAGPRTPYPVANQPGDTTA